MVLFLGRIIALIAIFYPLIGHADLILPPSKQTEVMTFLSDNEIILSTVVVIGILILLVIAHHRHKK